MERSFRAVLILLAGIALLATALSVQAILLELNVWALLAGVSGMVLATWGGYAPNSARRCAAAAARSCSIR
jgi:hypothetical protein